MAFMALPLITKAGAGLMKLGSALKGGTALKAAAGFGAGLPKAAAAGVGGMPGVARAATAAKAAATKAPQMAGMVDDGVGLLGRIKRGFTPAGFAANYGTPMTKDLGMAIAPDIMFGGLTMAMTPGDLGDKTLAGLGTAVGGAGGGLVTRGLLGPKSNMGIMMSELGGGLAGDMVGMNVADSIIRAKNGGSTPMEKQGEQQMEELRQQIINEYIRNGQ